MIGNNEYDYTLLKGIGSMSTIIPTMHFITNRLNCMALFKYDKLKHYHTNT